MGCMFLLSVSLCSCMWFMCVDGYVCIHVVSLCICSYVWYLCVYVGGGGVNAYSVSVHTCGLRMLMDGCVHA